eukprot:TRINITY_DN2761_c0_g1_i2.p1 TRINITY_DN2761_c0_g1~~TRINITY_DN2761_c0_g1_i2.p1  ORF type:complete len:108 (-),score=3.30 TRINITY_DN2761_c0_g1_i2:229-552(-)
MRRVIRLYDYTSRSPCTPTLWIGESVTEIPAVNLRNSLGVSGSYLGRISSRPDRENRFVELNDGSIKGASVNIIRSSCDNRKGFDDNRLRAFFTFLDSSFLINPLSI